ncbi:MAG: DNA polymerase III subunit delta [Buchnera aphidicola (Schlechtendalia peitan)]
MNIINPEQLFLSFFNNLQPYYIIIGNNEFFIHESEKIIFSIAQKYGFSKTEIIKIKYHIKYDLMPNFFKKRMFFKKKIVILDLSNTMLTESVQKKLSNLSDSINSDILLIIKKNKKEHILDDIWFKIFKLKGTIIYCHTLLDEKINIWIKNKIHNLKINICENAKNVLIKFYQGNIISLCNLLNVLALTWPNTKINKENILSIINDEAIFTLQEWIDTILIGDFKKSIRILNIFIVQNYNQIILIRYLQNYLLIILTIKNKEINNINCVLKTIKMSQSRYEFLKNIARKKSFKNMHESIQLLTKIEISIKKSYRKSIWNQLKILSHMISQNN